MIRPDGTVSDAILSPITEAQRVPSIGTQLTLTPEPATPARLFPTCCALFDLNPARGMHAHACPTRATTKPVPLNLWDTSADSIPETWSL